MAGYSKYSRAPGDSILALLEPGEYVLNRNAVNEIGKENLDDINFEDVPRFNMAQRQVGGMLGDVIGMQSGGAWEEMESRRSESPNIPSFGGLWDRAQDELAPAPPTPPTSPDYGGYQAPETGFEDLYEFYGMKPTDKQKEDFEKQYAYDPSREAPLFEQYRAGLETGREAAGAGAGEARQAAGQMGRGFAGAGTRGTAVQKSQESMYDAYSEQRRQAQSTLGQQLRGEKEDWMKQAGAGLTALQSAEGTQQYGASEDPTGTEYEFQEGRDIMPPSNPTHGQAHVYWNDFKVYWNEKTLAWDKRTPSYYGM